MSDICRACEKKTKKTPGLAESSMMALFKGGPVRHFCRKYHSESREGLPARAAKRGAEARLRAIL
jgi:hypothetical protein